MITITPRLKLQPVKALITYLEDDLRFDISGLDNMDAGLIKECIETGKKKETFKLLLKLIQHEYI
jgi:hypothetical protein